MHPPATGKCSKAECHVSSCQRCLLKETNKDRDRHKERASIQTPPSRGC